MEPRIAKGVADLLNARGFIAFEDYPRSDPLRGTDGKFADYICANEELLREQGYTGGSLEEYCTPFSSRTVYIYGVINTDKRPSEQSLNAYAKAVNSYLEDCGLTASDAKALWLELEYQCSCGATTIVDPKAIPHRELKLPIASIPALCRACKAEIAGPIHAQIKAGIFND